MEKRAEAYLYKGRVYVCPLVKTVHQQWISTEPVFEAAPEDIQEMGNAVARAISESRENETQPDFKTIADPVKSRLKIKSWTSFAKSANSVGISSLADHVAFFPKSYDYSLKGYIYLEGQEIKVNGGPDVLGSALRDAFAQCD